MFYVGFLIKNHYYFSLAGFAVINNGSVTSITFLFGSQSWTILQQ